MVTEIAGRYDKGLAKINETIKECQKYHDKLEASTPILMDKQRKLVEIVVDIEEEYRKITNMRDRMKRTENEQEQSVA